jgi:hypothetical protein
MPNLSYHLHYMKFTIGQRVSWTTKPLNLATRKCSEHLTTGTVYRVNKLSVAVLPDSWAKEGHTTGLIRLPHELTPLNA